MYTADAWAEIHDEEKNWSESGLFTGSSILGLHILEAIDGPDGPQARVASYYTRRDGPLGIQRVEVNTGADSFSFHRRGLENCNNCCRAIGIKLSQSALSLGSK